VQRAETCTVCLKTKHTDADLERWRKEVGEITRLGGDPLKHNPEWARALCWTKRESTCICKPASTPSTPFATRDR
jgi:hypothetical protein